MTGSQVRERQGPTAPAGTATGAVRWHPPTPLRRPGALARLATNASLLRAFGRPLLRFAPVLTVGKAVVVSRHDDVCDVLERDQDFTIAEINAASMDRVNGPFVLGMDRSELYTRERAILQGCVHADDPDRIRSLVRKTAADLIAAAQPRGRIDVVQDLARPAAIRLVASYFGVPGPDKPTMMRWMRALFHETFLNSGGDTTVRRAGELAAAEFHAYADELIGERRAQLEAGEPTPDDFLMRLIRAQVDPATRLSDEGVRRNIGGVVVGAVETTSKAVAQAVDQLLRHSQALTGAQQAARESDLRVVAQYTFEALRFNPLTPALLRHAARHVVVGEGTSHERCIPAGRTVYVAVLPAMFDPEVFGDPHAFRHDRQPAADLNFGHGMHSCFGRYVNLVQIPELVAALLRCEGLRRSPGRDGRMVYDGPFPDRLLLDLGAGPASRNGRG